MKNLINILFSCVGNEYGPELINSFGNNRFVKKIKIIGNDAKKSFSYKKLLDKSYLVPSPQKRTIDALKNKTFFLLLFENSFFSFN
jgi:hypothetical protein